MGAYIGIDVGTSGTKTLLIDERGEVLGSTTVEYPLHHPRPGWAEQDPEDWWRATVESIRRVLADSGVGAGEVKGLGLSGQMHGTVFLDEKNAVLRPAILWCDQRTAAECDEMTEAIGATELIKHTCNPALTGFSAPKILWLRNNEPAVYAKVRKVLLPKDYIRFRLSGAFAAEVSDASGTLLFDVTHRRWSDHVLDVLEIPRAWLPDVFESPEPSTAISAEAAEAMGLKRGTPIVGGGGDQAAGGIGNGIVVEGIVSSTIGTSGVVFASTDSPKLDEKGRVHTFCHAVPSTWHVMGVMLSAGGSFQWLRNVLGAQEVAEAKARGVDPYELLTANAAKAPVGSEGLIFLPYLSGERTPHADPYARGVFFGLSPRHDKAMITRAVMEGVTYGLRDSLELIRAMGVEIRQIRASGGGARSALWRRMQADVFESPVVTIDKDEGPAFGVALLAAVGTGAYGSVREACEATISVVSEVEPEPAASAVYNEYYPVYRQLYLDVKDRFKQTAGIVERLHTQRQ
jgi:xylulokinase